MGRTSSAAIRIGVVIVPDDRWAAARNRWRRAEQYGFDHAWTYDHLGWRHYSDGPWFAAVPTLAAAAAETTTIPLGIFVATPNFRHPIPFMRELNTLDDICGGRFVLGLGAGDDGYDAEVLGGSPLSRHARVDRFAEFVTALDGALTVDGFNHAGRFFTARGSRNLPGTLRRPRPDFVVAANSSRTMRLAIRYGAGWATTGVPAQTQGEWWRGVGGRTAMFDSEVERAERAPDSIDRYLNLDAAPESPVRSVRAFEDTLGRAVELGFTDVVMRWPTADSDGSAAEAIFERIAGEVLPTRPDQSV
ncbi:LLM class flavin-dependent oxidoreductase [Nocardia acidivorans]|uniref:LLM class flavin-dependent oxidoreductase n=1 Tax=Nocardia acidivorans TaxID=404580 RepID=UPI000A4081E3|nr:LLM class flavin-dependent oxidoreductase [Nocardia acidivorans]